jgi:hypothetical protein
MQERVACRCDTRAELQMRVSCVSPNMSACCTLNYAGVLECTYGSGTLDPAGLRTSPCRDACIMLKKWPRLVEDRFFFFVKHTVGC